MKRLQLLLLLFLAASFAWAGGSQPEDAATTTTATASPKGYFEAPMLAELVAKGELPPVDERLPDQPKVLEPLEEVGTYGGELTVFANGDHPWVDVGDSPESSQYPLRMNIDGSIEADQALDYEMSEDMKTFTLWLREGMKWSNGDPFYAEDFVFKYHDMDLNEKIDTWGLHRVTNKVVAVDDYTVRYEFSEPHPKHELDLVHWRGSDWRLYAPSTWLKQWHIDYNPKANEKAKEEGFEDWAQAFAEHYRFNTYSDIEKPWMHAWNWVEYTTTVRIWERNPYYYTVDTAGQQLPYIDRVVSQTVNTETYNLKVIAGEADYASYMSLADYPLLKQNEESGDYRLVLFDFIGGLGVVFGYNHVDPVKRELFWNLDFRRAMSLAIDRDEVNETAYFGLATPRQSTIWRKASYYNPEWGEEHPYARYDPDEANRLLDSIGLDKRNNDGIRLRKDGKPLQITILYGTGQWNVNILAGYELIKEYWTAVGVDTQLNAVDGGVMNQAAQETYTMDAYISGASAIEMYDWLSQGGTNGMHQMGCNLWWSYWIEEWDRSTGRSSETGPLPGEEPPEVVRNIYEWSIHQARNEPYGSPKYTELKTKVYDLHAENIFTIGVVGEAPAPMVYRSNMGNVPTVAPPWLEGPLSFNFYAPQWYYRK